MKTDQKTQEKPKQTPKNEQKPKTQEKPKKNPADPIKYDRYIELKFLQHDGGQLKEEYEKEIAVLEKELKECDGKIPKKTVTAAFGNTTIKLEKGVPVPEEIAKFINSQGHSKYYFD